MKKIAFLLILLNISFAFAQKQVSGVVKDNSGNTLPGVNIVEKGTQNGVSTDNDGSYKIKVKDGATLVFTYVGFNKVERAATEATINVVMSEEGGQNLNEVVVTGTRTAPRSNTTSALPIDVLSSKDLTSTGQATFDKALQYKIPSFNTVQTPVNDATSLLDPYEIRNMGPSRTLILINGKRKNMSSLVYTQTSPGRGETGSDISAIPTDAIERVEILRDGASAQYGSDAIAGVMNIILKKNASLGSVTLRSGVTSEGDGEMYGVSLNNGSTVGERGFINYTVDFSKVALANRPGRVNADGEVADFGANLADVNAFLALKPDAGNVNGSPETAAAKFLVNGGVNYNENNQMYYNAAYVYKKVNSFANYRTPYWRSVADMPYLATLFGNGTPASYQGYVPTFEGDLNDYNATIGYKTTKNGWNTDVSLTTGGNSQIYTVSNSQNRSFIDSNGNDTQDPGENFLYGINTPITFKPGGTSFTHYVGNIDISKNLTDQLSLGFGSEFRTENFEIFEGDLASYTGNRSGADSFQGNTPENSGKFNRYNLGAYLDLAYDVTEDFLINGTVRYEDYSDFGSATVWKTSTRYKFNEDKVTLRASLSTGFRAPSLHQIYTQKSQSSFVPGQGIVVQGLVNNVSSAARANGVPKLDSENSTNFTAGIGLKPNKNFNLTIDYYDIKVEDRIVLGNPIRFSATNTSAFFVNGIDSRTSGIDLVMGYKNLIVGAGKMGFNLSGNYTLRNEIDGPVKNPASVVAVNQSVIDATQEALLFTSRPEFKAIGGVEYEIGKFGLTLNNTLFGPTQFKNAGMSNDLRVEFLTKMVTDLGVTFTATDKLTLALNVNNILNVLPEWQFKAENAAGAAILNNPAQTRNQFNLVTFNGRYSQMTYDGYHFSQLGTMFNLSLNYKF